MPAIRSKLSSLLEQLIPGAKYEELNYDERDELNRRLLMLQKTPMTIEDVKTFVSNIRMSIERELVDEDEFIYVLGIFKRVNRKHIFLKAHLKFCILVEGFLTSKERAKAIMESYATQPPRPLI